MTFKGSYQLYDQKTMVKAAGTFLQISPKASREIAKTIKGMKVDSAIKYLQDVAEAKRAVPFKKYNRDTPHRKGKGFGPGRFPKKASEHVIKLLKSLKANASDKTLDADNLQIIHAAAQRGPVLWHYGRWRGRRRKCTHFEAVAKPLLEKKDAKEDKKKPGKKKKPEIKVEKPKEVEPIKMVKENVEKLNVIDEQGKIIGEETHQKIHKEGILHREVHVLVFNKKGEVLFQRRGPNKDTFPNLLDASAGGHVDLGEDYPSAAIHELEEETGIKTTKDSLILLGDFRSKAYDKVTGNTNNALKKVYAYEFDGNPNDLKVEEGEATSLEFWPIKKLSELSDKEKKEFIQTILSDKYFKFYKKIEEMIKQSKKKEKPKK